MELQASSFVGVAGFSGDPSDQGVSIYSGSLSQGRAAD